VDVFAIQDEIAATIREYAARHHVRRRVRAYPAALTPKTSTPTACTSKVDMRGTSGRRKASPRRVSYFEQAIAEDPGYAPAYAGLGRLLRARRRLPGDTGGGVHTAAPRSTPASACLARRIPAVGAPRRCLVTVCLRLGLGRRRSGVPRAPLEAESAVCERSSVYAFLLASRGEHERGAARRIDGAGARSRVRVGASRRRAGSRSTPAATARRSTIWRARSK